MSRGGPSTITAEESSGARPSHLSYPENPPGFAGSPPSLFGTLPVHDHSIRPQQPLLLLGLRPATRYKLSCFLASFLSSGATAQGTPTARETDSTTSYSGVVSTAWNPETTPPPDLVGWRTATTGRTSGSFLEMIEICTDKRQSWLWINR